MTCDCCGALLDVGDWPWCPHGRGTYAAVADDIPGGLVVENLGPKPVTVYSHSERRRLAKERGLVEFVRNHGGSWHTASSTTLENGRRLVAGDRRTGRQHPDPADPVVEVETLEMTVRELDTGFRVKPDGEPYV